MADTMESEAADGGSSAAKRKGLIIAVCVTTLLAVAGGAGVGLMVTSTVEQAVAAKAKTEVDVKPAVPVRYSGDMMLQELKPVLTNLAAPSSTWVRLEASIIFKNGDIPNPEIAAAEIRDDIMSYLRTLSLSELEGPSALLHLRDDLGERASLRTDGRVAELVIESFVVQ
jgi:flagellar protein FliL